MSSWIASLVPIDVLLQRERYEKRKARRMRAQWPFRNVTPRAFRRKKISQDIAGNVLFDGEDEYFKEAVSKSAVYGEYGVGRSTVWASRNTSARIISVDTDESWIARASKYTANNERALLLYVNLGATGNWGRPVGFSRRALFRDYANAIWGHEHKPDLVLIDGRFRVCCFLTSLRRAAPGTVIIFDDYLDRPHYHVVEEFIQPRLRIGRQGIFVVPDLLNGRILEQEIEKFSYVMD